MHAGIILCSLLAWMPVKMFFTVMDGRQPSSCRQERTLALYKAGAAHYNCGACIGQICGLGHTSLRMDKQTVPDGYTLGWKKLVWNLHCMGTGASGVMSLLTSAPATASKIAHLRRLGRVVLAKFHRQREVATFPVCARFSRDVAIPLHEVYAPVWGTKVHLGMLSITGSHAGASGAFIDEACLNTVE